MPDAERSEGAVALEFGGEEVAEVADVEREVARALRALVGADGTATVVLRLRITSKSAAGTQSALTGRMVERMVSGPPTEVHGGGDLAARARAMVEAVLDPDVHFTYKGRVVGGELAAVARVGAPPKLESGPMRLRMRYAGARTSLAVDEDGGWDTGRGTCVYDFVLHRYGRMRAVRAGGAAYLRALIERGVDTLAHGVCTAELAAFAARHDLRMFAAGVDGAVFYARRDGASKHPPLAYAVANGHLFPVTDPAEIAVMAQYGRLRHRGEAHAPPPRDVAPREVAADRAVDEALASAPGAHLVVDAHDLTPAWCDAMRRAGRTLNAGTRVRDGTRLVRFHVGGVRLTANAAWPAVRRVAEALGVAARPTDGVGAVARRAFEARVPVLAHLAVSPQPAALARGTLRTAFVGTLGDAPRDTPNDEALRCFDVRRCYATQLEGNDGFAWAVMGPFDAVEPFDGRALSPGRYFVRGGGAALDSGARWCYERWARRAVEHGAVVVLQQRARRTLDARTFADAVAQVRAALDPDAAKLVVNSFIGGLRGAAREGGRCFATTDAEEARVAAGAGGLVATLGGFRVAYALAPRAPRAELEWLYDQIVEGGWDALDRLCAAARALAPRCAVVAVKTDAVVVRGLAAAHTATDLARVARVAVREEPRATLPSHALVPRAHLEPDGPTEPAWCAADGAPCLFVGMAGTGKTFRARAALAACGRRVLAVGPTVKAAANVGGVTLHALFGIFQPESFADPPTARVLKAVARRYDALLVDEVFMCAEWMLCALLVLRRAGVRLVLAGDPAQLPPVGELAVDPRAVARSALMHELVDGRVCELVAPQRTRRAPRACWLFDACRALVDAPCSRRANAAFVARFAPCDLDSAPERNMAYLNATCARVNAALALRRKRGRRWLVCDVAAETTTLCRGVWALRRALAAAGAAPVVFPTGAPVLARSAALGFRRGERATIAALDDDAALVGHARVPHADVPRAFELAYCVTIHRSQCESIDEPFAVHDTAALVRGNARLCRTLLYVAASRATRASLVHVAP